MDPICDPFYGPNFATRTLHVIGRTDVVVVEERSRQLAELSANKRVEEHDGGKHFDQEVILDAELKFIRSLCPYKGTLAQIFSGLHEGSYCQYISRSIPQCYARIGSVFWDRNSF